jgi:hypothetical protein
MNRIVPVILALTLSCLLNAQVGVDFLRDPVQKWLSDARALETSATRADSEMAAAYSSLGRKVPGDVRQSAVWAGLQKTFTGFEGDIHGWSQILLQKIALDEKLLRQLRPGDIETDAVAANLTARTNEQQANAAVSDQLVQSLKKQGEELRSLPQSVMDLPEFHQLTQKSDALAELLGNAGQEFRARSVEYATMNRNLVGAVGATSKYSIEYGQAGSLVIEYAIKTTRNLSMFTNTVSGHCCPN